MQYASKDVKTSAVLPAHIPVVLCVDDDRSALRLLTEYLRGSGFEVVSESEFGRAIRQICDVAFDAVILEHQFHGWDGIELAEIIHNKRPGVPILMFASGGSAAVESVPITAFVPKSLGLQCLAEKLCTALGI